MGGLKFSEISQKTPDMYSASSAYIGDVSKRADQEPTAVPDNCTPSSSLAFLSPVVFSPPGFLFAHSRDGYIGSMSEASENGIDNGNLIGRESQVVPGRFGEPLQVTHVQ